MNQQQAEELAVDYLNHVIGKHPSLTSNLEKFSTFPSYDGRVLVYDGVKGESRLAGMIDCQVKGHAIKPNESFSFKKHRFQCEISFLKDYYLNGGCLFFVVEFKQKGLADFEYEVYYLDLLPFLAKKYIDKHAE